MTNNKTVDAVVAGHLCLDLIPEFKYGAASFGDLLRPGMLLDVGPAESATGGAVSNTGRSLHRLDCRVRLLAKIGTDPFGDIVCNLLREESPGLETDLVRDGGVATSYSVVLNPPGIDRVFLHCPGANDSFRAADMNPELLMQARLLHFGYPPLMRRMYDNQGRETEALLNAAREAGCVTSLDMALPDPESAAGRADWPRILKRILPKVDIFLPSVEEICFMLGEPAIDDPASVSGRMLHRIGDRLLAMGAAVVLIKLGSGGAYLRICADTDRLAACAAAMSGPDRWCGGEYLAPCYSEKVIGTAGAGDCTIAGFLAGMLHGLGPEDSLHAAVATGAFNVRSADALGGIPGWPEVLERFGGPQDERTHPGDDWAWSDDLRLWVPGG